MRVVSIELENFRSFVSLPALALGTINVLTGHNNTGKSSIIAALYLLQQESETGSANIRNGQTTARVSVGFKDVYGVTSWGDFGNCGNAVATLNLQRNAGLPLPIRLQAHQGHATVAHFPKMEPDHLVVPFFSKRKTGQYVEDVRKQHALQIASDMTFLSARLSRLSNPGFPGHDRYSEYCKKILGFPVYTVPSENGQKAGIYLDDGSAISIESMGEGVANIASLLASLITSKDKLFLIEEPENDLHPGALRELLELIVESAKHNQFVVSTHSNIVVQYLAGAPDSKLFNVKTKFGELPPVASVEEVPPTPAARINALRDLGYTLADFELWEGWLILEESSAERIIRDFIIPWFFPRLSCLRTLSANGVDGVPATFNDLHRVLKFSHLTPIYQARTWVVVDGDEAGNKVVEKLRQTFPSWSEDRFRTLERRNFEDYYPAPFREKVQASLAESNKDAKREAKRRLLLEVVDWLKEDPERGQAALEVSAAEILGYLGAIQIQIVGAAAAGT